MHPSERVGGKSCFPGCYIYLYSDSQNLQSPQCQCSNHCPFYIQEHECVGAFTFFLLNPQGNFSFSLLGFLISCYWRTNRNYGSRAVVSDRWADQLWPSFWWLVCLTALRVSVLLKGSWRATVLSSDFKINSCLGPVYIFKFVIKSSFSIKY